MTLPTPETIRLDDGSEMFLYPLPETLTAEEAAEALRLLREAAEQREGDVAA